MKPLYTTEQFEKAQSKDLLPLECYYCKKEFHRYKNYIKRVGIDDFIKCKYCSQPCLWEARTTKIKFNCTQCNIQFKKRASDVKKTKNHFCSHSCSATYQNTHKKYGTRRSKLEVWIEDKLNELYPKIEIKFNDKETINSELDIYIPSLNIAFELNGIFHYEPIYGESKLTQIKNNDTRKFQACIEKGIELCILDTSSLSYFKVQKTQVFLDIIVKIINEKL